jgi:hypothetical protein
VLVVSFFFIIIIKKDKAEVNVLGFALAFRVSVVLAGLPNS